MFKQKPLYRFQYAFTSHRSFNVFTTDVWSSFEYKIVDGKNIYNKLEHMILGIKNK